MNLYVSYYSYDFLTEVNLDTLTRVRAYGFATGEGESVEDCVRVGDYLYMGRNTLFNAQIVKFHLPTFTETARLTLPENPGLGSGSPHCGLRVVGNILYVAIDRPDGIPVPPNVPGGIVRINLDTFTRIDRLDLADQNPHIATDGTYLYVGYFIIAGIDRIDRVNLTTFAIDNTVNLTNPETMAMYVYGNYLYTTHAFGPGPDTVTRINLTTFTEDGNLLLAAGEAWGYSLVSDGTYLYCGTLAGVGLDGYLVRIDLATFTRVDNIVFLDGSGEEDVVNLFIYDNFIWILTENVPASIVKINIPTFTRLDALTLLPTEGDSWAGALWELPAAPTPPYSLNRAYALSREEL